MARIIRRLSAVVSLDVVGFTAMVEADERGTLALVAKVKNNLIDQTLAEHGGELFKTMGDGALIEFPSAVSAIEWTLQFQKAMRDQHGSDSERPISIRAGVALADVVVDGQDRFGKGVNLAVRVQQAAPVGGIAITEHAFVHSTGEISAVFKAAGGHRFKNINAVINIWTWAPEDEPPAASEDAEDSPARTARDERPSIVVLPFDYYSDDPSKSYLADGLVEEITATLSRVRDFTVIARNSAYAYKQRSASMDEIRETLGVRYVLEGSMRRAGQKVRVTAQLIDAESSHHLWSESFDGNVDDVFDLQDYIAEHVAGALMPSIRYAEIQRAKRKHPENLAAYDLLMQAMPHLWAHRKHDNQKAIELLQQALDLASGYGLAAALQAWACAQQVAYNWTLSPEVFIEQGTALIDRAFEAVYDDPTGLTALGAAITLLHADTQRARGLIERALMLDPNHAWAWTRKGFIHAYQSEAEEAIECFEHAMRLSPLDPFAFNCYIGMGFANFAARRCKVAAQWTRQALEEKPAMRWPYRDLAAFLADCGEIEEARAAVERFKEAQPEATVSLARKALRFMGPQLLERYLNGLRLAGLPD